MPLTHVCVWDSKTGYRRVTVEEACEMYPYGASARSGHFVCELCAQNVLLTAPGMNVQHFRHDPASPNKECDERQASFDPNYGRSLRALNSHIMPLRLVVTGSIFSLQLGFFYPPDNKAHCDKIKIAGDSHQVYEYSFERIERIGTTYLSVGSIPSQIYGVEYVNANTELKRFWSNKITGINTTGSFFDGRTGQILQSGGKAYSGNSYYLLQRCPLYSYHTDIEATEVARNQASPFTTWYLYKIRIKKFSAYSAKFFLKYAIFLTEKPTKFYPIWPAYINDPYFIYHNSPEFYFYLCGDDAELKSYPATANVLGIQDGKLYKLYTREREQLISLGKSGALGFSYLVKQPLRKKAPLPAIIISDHSGNTLNEESYAKLPKFKCISVSCPYDGKAVVQRNGKTEYIYKLSGEEHLTIDELSFGTEIHFYQGCDYIRSIRLEQETVNMDVMLLDAVLVKKLSSCSGPMIPVTHAVGSFASKFSKYPQTQKWLCMALRRGEISRTALNLLRKTIQNNPGRDNDD